MGSHSWWVGLAAALMVLGACQTSSTDQADPEAGNESPSTPSTVSANTVPSTSAGPGATVDSADDVADVRTFGAAGDGTTDDTDAVQAAIDDVAGQGGGTVRFPPGTYLVTQLEWRRGVNLVGEVTGRGGEELGSEIAQADGATDSLIITDTDLDDNEFFHWTAMENLRLTGAGDGSGRDGVTVRSRSGENFRIHRVLAAGFPRHGIALTRGGAPTTMTDIHVFGNGSAGIYITRRADDRYQTFHAELISGDDNGLALVLLEGVGASEELFYFEGLKLESSIEGRQPYGIVLDDTNVAHVFIRNVSAIATGEGSMSALIAVRGSDARFWLEGFRRSDERVAAVVVDEVRGTTFEEFGDFSLSYTSGAVRYRSAPGSITDGAGRELRPVEAGQGRIREGETSGIVSHGLGTDAVITITPRGPEQIWIESVADDEFTVRRSAPGDEVRFEWIGSVG